MCLFFIFLRYLFFMCNCFVGYCLIIFGLCVIMIIVWFWLMCFWNNLISWNVLWLFRLNVGLFSKIIFVFEFNVVVIFKWCFWFVDILKGWWFLIWFKCNNFNRFMVLLFVCLGFKWL